SRQAGRSGRGDRLPGVRRQRLHHRPRPPHRRRLGVSAQPLAEISERAATGEIAAIYAELRATLGVPLVNLVFRHMATVPGCLEWAWRCLAPLYRGEAIHRAGANMAAMARAIQVSAKPAKIDLPKNAIAATLEAYI